MLKNGYYFTPVNKLQSSENVKLVHTKPGSDDATAFIDPDARRRDQTWGVRFHMRTKETRENSRSYPNIELTSPLATVARHSELPDQKQLNSSLSSLAQQPRSRSKRTTDITVPYFQRYSKHFTRIRIIRRNIIFLFTHCDVKWRQTQTIKLLLLANKKKLPRTTAVRA